MTCLWPYLWALICLAAFLAPLLPEVGSDRGRKVIKRDENDGSDGSDGSGW